ncbi:MAG: SHOCT domain-containing protein [Bacilli bacterium]
MKNSSKLKRWGFIQLGVALALILLGSTIFRDTSWDGFAWAPNFALFVPGLFLFVLSLPILAMGFSPQLTRFQSKLHSETMDYAKEDLQSAIHKTADVIVPAVTPSIQTIASVLAESTSPTPKTDRASQLREAQKLYDDHLISLEEYTQMRKDILDIEER